MKSFQNFQSSRNFNLLIYFLFSSAGRHACRKFSRKKKIANQQGHLCLYCQWFQTKKAASGSEPIDHHCLFIGLKNVKNSEIIIYKILTQILNISWKSSMMGKIRRILAPLLMPWIEFSGIDWSFLFNFLIFHSFYFPGVQGTALPPLVSFAHDLIHYSRTPIFLFLLSLSFKFMPSSDET